MLSNKISPIKIYTKPIEYEYNTFDYKNIFVKYIFTI